VHGDGDWEAPAMTRLDKTLKRELRIKGKPHVLTIDPDGFKLTKKGRRKGIEIAWKDLISGDAAMAVALDASLGKLKA
jgi:hypothetical protein